MNYLLSKGIKEIPKIPDKNDLKDLFNPDQTLKMNFQKQQTN